jgi:LmbE family N-acetylglucosaminyl deacetylase
MPKKKKSVLILCAHSDDQTIGVGGTMAKYASEDYDVYTVIFSYGEKGNPHIKEEHLVPTRIKESEDADRIVGGKEVMFLGLKEGRFDKDFDSVKNKLFSFIKKIRPEKIFTHAVDDAHPDHRVVYRKTLEIYDDLKLKSDVYSFEIWNIFNFGKRDHPKFVVDISEFYDKKKKALMAFKSQIDFTKVYGYITMNNWLVLVTYFKDWVNGFKNNCKQAEVFYKVR